MAVYLSMFDMAWWTFSRMSSVMFWLSSRRNIESDTETQLRLTNNRLMTIERDISQLYAFQTHQSRILTDDEILKAMNDVVIIDHENRQKQVSDSEQCHRI